ncbi:hypothetical protein [Brevundimonas sp. Root1279]|uniref:hypothetical protein n=1 Tax=Brevundimonas sp. Root1279 TaxID=1736443 RepID=UPI0006F9287C|nr:hypothetical protein [Brevundimonas sp. Root1279]KQW82435.1 hypothetical protein ASC65_09325 [Brevundimonas sp. Root1279]
MTFSDAVELHRALMRRPQLTDTEDRALCRAEAAILSRKPQSMIEVIEMLDLLSDSLNLGPRSDGLDLRAVKNLKQWVRELAWSRA